MFGAFSTTLGGFEVRRFSFPTSLPIFPMCFVFLGLLFALPPPGHKWILRIILDLFECVFIKLKTKMIATPIPALVDDGRAVNRVFSKTHRSIPLIDTSKITLEIRKCQQWTNLIYSIWNFWNFGKILFVQKVRARQKSSDFRKFRGFPRFSYKKISKTVPKNGKTTNVWFDWSTFVLHPIVLKI